MAILGIILIVRGRLAPSFRSVKWPEGVHAIAILVCCAFSTLAMESLGYRISMAIILAFLFGVMEHLKWWLVLSLSLVLSFGSFWVFDTMLKVILPRGELGFLMIETVQNLYFGFATALTPLNLFYGLVGCLIGTLLDLSGVGPLAGISLLLPTTFGLNPASALILLSGIYYGAMYGGSTTSILMRIPGEAASVMTCIDGYAMAQKGRAGPALAISAIGSYIAGTASVIGLMLLAPPLAKFALGFGPPEICSCSFWACWFLDI